MADNKQPLPEYYTGYLTATGWRLDCKAQGCAQRYSLTLKGAAHPGNILALLNHARSHEARDARKAKRKS